MSEEKLYRLELNLEEIDALDDILDLYQDIDSELHRGINENAVEKIRRMVIRKQEIIIEEGTRKPIPSDLEELQ